MTASKSEKFDPIRILKKAGVTIQTCFVESDDTLRGEFAAVRVRGFDYKNDDGYPWDDIIFFKMGTGSGDGNGAWKGAYTIYLQKTPAAFRKSVIRAITALKAAELTHRKALQECSHSSDFARQEAWTKASLETGLADLQDRAWEARQKFTAFLVR